MSVALLVQKLRPIQNRAKSWLHLRFAQKDDDFESVVTFDQIDIQTWFLYIFHSESDYLRLLKHKNFKILNQKIFGHFLGSFWHFLSSDVNLYFDHAHFQNPLGLRILKWYSTTLGHAKS